MSEINRNETIEYLQKVADLEYGIYSMEQLTKETEKLIENTKYQQGLKHGVQPKLLNSTLPILTEKTWQGEIPKKPTKPIIKKNPFSHWLFSIPIFVSPYILYSGGYLLLALLSEGPKQFIKEYREAPLTINIVIILNIYIVAYIIFYMLEKNNKKQLKSYEEELKRYEDYINMIKDNEEIRELNKNAEESNKIRAEQDRITNERALSQWQQEEDKYQNSLAISLNNEELLLKEAENQLAKYTQELNELYDKDVIYHTYRGLVPVCTMLEYFKSGRVYEFTGPNGAYNLYENELRQNIIIGNLQNLNRNSSEIFKTQKQMIRNIEKINSRIDNLTNEISSQLSDINYSINDVGKLVGMLPTHIDVYVPYR